MKSNLAVAEEVMSTTAESRRAPGPRGRVKVPSRSRAAA